MLNLCEGLEELEQASFWAAPSHGRVTPATIQHGTEVIELLTGGEVFFHWQGEERRFVRGAIFWHQGGEKTICKTTSTAPYRCAVFRFRVNRALRWTERVWQWRSSLDLEQFAAECIELFHAAAANRQALAVYVYGMLLRQTIMEAGAPEVAGKVFPLPLLRALEQLQQDGGLRLTVKALAEKAGIGRAQLFRLFTEHLHQAPHRYRRQLQLARARNLLATNNLEIKIIAGECGFDNLEVFYRCFKQGNGMTPREYRKRNQAY